jgi:hypothetical protein
MPMFTKRHYEAIAQVLRDADRPADQLPVRMAYVATKLADVFANDNPFFDRERFLRAALKEDT